MSLLADDSRLPSFVLRKHTKPVTALAFVRVPAALTRKTITNDKHTAVEDMTLKPFLLSGDEGGKVLLWDLATRRTVMDKQCHKMHILTIKQLGLNGGVVDEQYFGLILTHGRDNCVKFWNLFDDQGSFSFDELYELPENALNFSNVDVCGDKLVTPNTMNSNALDVYDIGFLTAEKLDERRLVRDLEAVDVYKTASMDGHNFEEFKIQREEDDMDPNRVDKFGIIMKLLWAKEDVLFVGYESGHVAALRVRPSLRKFEVLSITHHHYPNPVLSLSYDRVNDVILSTSVSAQIVLHDLQTYDTTPVKTEKFGKISSVATVNDKYVLSSWNGLIKFYTLDDEKTSLSYHHTFKKPKGMIAGDLNIIGNLQGNDDIKKKGVIKPNTMATVDKSEVKPRMRGLVGRRDVQVITSSFLSVAYDDGTIAVYADV